MYISRGKGVKADWAAFLDQVASAEAEEDHSVMVSDGIYRSMGYVGQDKHIEALMWILFTQ